jgi:hypothetical protein
MTVSKKGKRRISIDEQTYFWWIYEDTNFFAPSSSDYMALSILSEDGKNNARYHLGQTDPERSHVLLNWYIGETHLKGLFRTPVFLMDPVTPKSVFTLVNWIHAENTVFTPVNFQGYEGEIRRMLQS